MKLGIKLVVPRKIPLISTNKFWSVGWEIELHLLENKWQNDLKMKNLTLPQLHIEAVVIKEEFSVCFFPFLIHNSKAESENFSRAQLQCEVWMQNNNYILYVMHKRIIRKDFRKVSRFICSWFYYLKNYCITLEYIYISYQIMIYYFTELDFKEYNAVVTEKWFKSSSI